MRAYRIAFAIAGTMIAAASAAATAGLLALFVLPMSIALGCFALWTIQSARDASVPLATGCASSLVLVAVAVVYTLNGGNWNQPGREWLVLPLLSAVMVLSANAFAIYVRFVAGGAASLAGGPALVAIAAGMFWWVLQADAGRADLYVYRLASVFASLYAMLAVLLVADRSMRSAAAKTQKAGSDDPAHT